MSRGVLAELLTQHCRIILFHGKKLHCNTNIIHVETLASSILLHLQPSGAIPNASRRESCFFILLLDGRPPDLGLPCHHFRSCGGTSGSFWRWFYHHLWSHLNFPNGCVPSRGLDLYIAPGSSLAPSWYGKKVLTSDAT